MSLARSCNHPGLWLHLVPPLVARIFLLGRINIHQLAFFIRPSQGSLRYRRPRGHLVHGSVFWGYA